jgi:hypothetical protein
MATWHDHLDQALSAVQELQRRNAECPIMQDQDIPPDLRAQMEQTLAFLDEHGIGTEPTREHDPVRVG